ncbi:MAG TPA: hypothetical protein VFO40_21280 [Chthoniobacterales bacterium]|nr:hypothetical protein [Chthoniobacterales bacterium]
MDPLDPAAAPIFVGQTLIIEGEKIPATYREMDLADVRLDPNNPRIQHAVKQKSKGRTLTQEELRDLILDLPGVPDLFKSIRDNAGLFEPIYVRPDGRIIEGNCRAACYLRLHDIASRKKDDRWQKISAIFVPKISDRQIAVLQGYYHVAGKNKWRAYEKAGHIYRMHTALNMDEKAIAKVWGMREGEVKKDLESYQVMTEKLLPKMKNGNGLEKWSFVQELFKRKQLEDFRSKPSNVDQFVSLVVNNKLKRGTDVRKFEKIVKHPRALEKLKKEGIDGAMIVVGNVDPTANSRTFKKLKEATHLLLRLQGSDLEKLRENEKTQAILRDLFQAVNDAAKTARVKLK